MTASKPLNLSPRVKQLLLRPLLEKLEREKNSSENKPTTETNER